MAISVVKLVCNYGLPIGIPCACPASSPVSLSRKYCPQVWMNYKRKSTAAGWHRDEKFCFDVV